MMYRHHLMCTAVLFGLMGTPATVLAQGKAMVSAEQQKLANRAVSAIRAKKYDRAVELLEQSLKLGESNATWMNLGRAYYYAGHCAKAAEAFDKTTTAAKVMSPSPSEIASTLQRYRNDLETTCPGTITVQCVPGTLAVTVDGSQTLSCGASLELPAGSHIVEGVIGTQSIKREVQVRGTRRTDVTLELAPEALLQVAQEELAAGRFESARDTTRAVLNGVDSNLGRVVLARALFKLGDCRDAARELKRAADAPLPPGLKLDDVLRLRDEYQAELQEGCPGYVSVTCEPATVMIQVDDAPPAVCPGDALALPPGPHEVTAYYEGATDKRTIEVSALDEAELSFTMEAPADLGGLSLVIAGSGAALLLAGAVWDVALLAPASDDYQAAADRGDKGEYDSLRSDIDTHRSVIFAAYGLGGAAVVTGAILWWLQPDATPDMASAQTFVPFVSPHGAGATWRLPF